MKCFHCNQQADVSICGIPACTEHVKLVYKNILEDKPEGNPVLREIALVIYILIAMVVIAIGAILWQINKGNEERDKRLQEDYYKRQALQNYMERNKL